jgi:hypothetical protein
MTHIANIRRALWLAAAILAFSMASEAALAQSTGLSREDDLNAPGNNTQLMPNAPLGSQYPTHGNRQAGELNLNPVDPRAQLINGQPNNAEAGGIGSPLAGNKSNVPPGE